jgi:hypothetical protein
MTQTLTDLQMAAAFGERPTGQLAAALATKLEKALK